MKTKMRKFSNTNNSNKLPIVISLVTLLALAVLLFINSKIGKAETKLDAENKQNNETLLNIVEIREERERYPYLQLFPEDSIADFGSIPYASLGEMQENFVYVEITEVLDVYYDKIGTNNYQERFTSFTAKVINDAKNVHSTNDADSIEESSSNTIELTSIELDDALVPSLERGNRYLLPISELSSEEHPNRFRIGREGSYYVNEKGFVLSFYEIEDYTIFDGNQVEAVLAKLAKDLF